jgi:succinate-acetate transporter protein
MSSTHSALAADEKSIGPAVDVPDEPIKPHADAAAAIADPVGLGLAAFGLTTFTLSTMFVGAVSLSAIPVGLALALIYGGLTQFLSGMWAFKEGNTFAAVGAVQSVCCVQTFGSQ